MCVKTFFTFLVLFALSGCVNTTPATDSYYYILDTMPQQKITAVNVVENLEQIKVRPVTLPDYLNQPNLVLKLSDHQIKIANYHFWAENLRQSIQRVLINELNANNSEISFTQACAKCDELVITIDHFYPTQNGEVVLVGSYYLTSNYTQNRFILKRELEQGGYNEAVSAMRALLTDLAEQI